LPGFISECQTVDTAQQLRDGARFIDVRLRIINGELQSEYNFETFDLGCGMLVSAVRCDR